MSTWGIDPDYSQVKLDTEVLGPIRGNMPRHTQRIVVKQELLQVLEACQLAVAQMGWRVLSQGDSSIKLKEVSPQSTSYTWAAEIEVQLLQTPE